MELKISPPNSILFIFDRASQNIKIPPYQASNILSISENCISIGTLSEFDGVTTIKLIKNCADVKKKYPSLHWFNPISLTTPSFSLSIVTSENKTLESIQTESKSIMVSVGVSDISEPDLIIVCAD